MKLMVALFKFILFIMLFPFMLVIFVVTGGKK